ncbi:MAG: thiolase family protein [Deltaproteobacteria bacterium]|nr:thiolase family protein [Deltaproteobacteria bacterium]MBW1818931.1 thiolase family protein [Deltaproteobacteria bacterium]
MREVVVIGAGFHPYGVFTDISILDFGKVAIRNALKDANMEWGDIETAYCGTVQPHMSTGHQICQQMGLTGIGITNVENASASGSSAFREAYLAVASEGSDVALAMGVDKTPVRPKSKPRDGAPAKEKNAFQSEKKLPVQFFAAIAQQHMAEYGTTRDQLARVSVKSHYNAGLNPNAHFQKAVTPAEVHEARMVANPLTVLHCCPWDDGGAAVIVCAKEIAGRYTDKTCPTVASSVLKSVLADGDPISGLTEFTANLAYEQAGVGPEDLDLIELHDAFTIEEIIYSEALGLCAKGEGGRLVDDDTTSLNGKHPINSSGGLISMGHPIGPTGVGQIAEILWQMRGECGKRQVQKPVRLAMAHMVGAGGVCVVHLFKT